MLTAEQVYLQANINPSDFGTEIIPYDAVEEDQKRLAIAHIETYILPAAVSNVEVPWLQVAHGSSLPFPLAVLVHKYPGVDQSRADEINLQLSNLRDSTILSYARSEIMKQVATNNKSYDTDSDQDRRNGDMKLAQLLDMVKTIVTANPGVVVGGQTRGRPISQSIQAGFVL